MVKLNKNLLYFLVLALMLGGGVVTVLNKFRPLFLQHSVYYCQQFLQSFSIKIPSQLGLFILGVVFLLILGALLKLVTTFLEVQKLRVTLKKQQKKYIAILLKKLDLQDKVYIVSSQKLLAFCFGIRNPKIYLSTKLLATMSKKELEAILIHEKYHLENKDNFILLFAHITTTLFPFFPLLSDLMNHYRVIREIEADKQAIQRLGNEPMITVLKKLLSTPALRTLPVSALGDFDTLEERINAITQKHAPLRKFHKTNIAISLLSLGIFIAVLITPVQAVTMQGMGSKDNSTMLCLQGDVCATWCKEHNTVVPYSSSENASHMYSSTK